jgi:NAD(P)H-dependent FMN reductase
MRILLISGSTRAASSNTRALQELRALRRPGVATDWYPGLRELPAFVPDEQPVPPAVTDLLGAITAADAVVLSTPEYAGGLPGALKNLLDWTVGGGELYGRPVAWLDVANPGRGAGARAQLETVLGYVGARIVPDACRHVDLERTAEGLRLAPGAERELAAVLSALAAVVEEDPGDRAAG